MRNCPKRPLSESSAKHEAAAEVVAVYLRHILRRRGFVDPQGVPTRVSSRVKTLQSAARKINLKRRTKGVDVRAIREKVPDTFWRPTD